LVAHLLCKQGVRGSSPRASTIGKSRSAETLAGTFVLAAGLRNYPARLRIRVVQ
jgi:hypothetical protein